MELPAQNKTTKYEHLLPQIAAVEQAEELDGLLVLLNTVGGDVEAGLAIAELIAGMKKPTVSLVLGGGHSIGVPLAVAAKRSFIAVSAAMTIHPVRMNGTIIAAVSYTHLGYTNCASVFAPNGRGVALYGARETAASAAGTKRKGHLRFCLLYTSPSSTPSATGTTVRARSRR